MIKAFNTEWFDRLTGKIEYLHRYLSEEQGEHNDTSQCIYSYVASEMKHLGTSHWAELIYWYLIMICSLTVLSTSDN